MHARPHFLELKRLGDVVHTADFERLELVFRFRQGAQKDDGDIGQIRVLFQPLAHLVPVQSGILMSSRMRSGGLLFAADRASGPLGDGRTL